MGAIERYDTELQMFCEPTREPSLDRLTFERWLVQTGHGEHGPAGPAGGPLVTLANASPEPLRQLAVQLGILP